MLLLKSYTISLFLVLLTGHLPAQNITGTWEGNMGGYQHLQLNIIQNGNKVCGYTRDYLKNDTLDHCKAYFEGFYNKRNGELILYGTSFIETKGQHFLMQIKLFSSMLNGQPILEGESIASDPSRASFGNQPYTIDNDSLYLKSPDSVYLKKVSNKPQDLLGYMKDCFPKSKKVKDTKTVPFIAVKHTDTIIKINLPPVVITDSVTKPVPFKRKNTEQSHIDVNVKNITLHVYDNAMIDNDTVSIFYNGKLLMSHQRLSEKPIIIKLELDEKQTRHEIILFAENLGSIPPNTALIVIYAGDKRYELFSSASLEENAVLVFDYRPKPTEKQ